MKRKITTVEEFSENITARGPDSNRPFEDIIEDIMPASVFHEWRQIAVEAALALAQDHSNIEHLLDALGDDVDKDDPEVLISASMAVALDRCTNAAFAAGLFSGMAAHDDKGFLESLKRDGWNIPEEEK